ncbi:MAG: hypothetical protein ACE5J3_12310, partial [Methanosarcinales archaeon]
YREATIVTILKNNIIKQLKELGYNIEVTFGNITKVNRIQLGLPKNHYNDAIAIALNTGNIKVIQPDTYFINKCFPKGNYKLFKGAHSHIRNQGERYMFGYQRNDIVKVNKNGKKGIGYIKGRMSSGYFVIYDFLGNKLFSSVHHRYLKLVERFKTLSTMEVRNATCSGGGVPSLKDLHLTEIINKVYKSLDKNKTYSIHQYKNGNIKLIRG